ncbi:type II toxin-antitoxin system HicB family antitoxin [Labrys wisconsinensis]|uniref:HicB family RNase H-like nuclease n=1 Tax=Labrys wisconsinensis TaxID=425677 RepID=A0ABU0IYR2_9HYPH|nr:type II toxin-antitoxin system HicB family antitoxin [Labrys wisconsinensis]MDQ0467151.1 putative HicB family RNase H-like nuclease [Labrys wisconsinensis]
MTVMHYKGYEGVVDYDEEAEIFHGEVINLRDVITFQGTSVSELKQALADSVEDYLAYCRERGEEPEKPFSGHFVVRAEPALHRAMFSAAKRAGMSLNKWVTSTLERAVSR